MHKSKRKREISIRLHKRSVKKYDDILKDEYKKEYKKNTEELLIRRLPKGVVNGKAYIVTNQEKLPSWKDSFEYLTGGNLKVPANHSSKALIIFKVIGSDGKTYFMSISFGYGSSMIDDSTVNSDFGMNIAAKKLSENNIISVNTIKVGSNTIQNQKQYVDSNSEGITGLIDNNSEFSSSVTGVVKNGSVESKITGSNGLLKSVRSIENNEIFDDAKYYLNIYLNTDETAKWMSKLVKVSDKSINDELTNLLLEKIVNHNMDYGIAWPNFMNISNLSIDDLSKRMPDDLMDPIDQLNWYMDYQKERNKENSNILQAIKKKHVTAKNSLGEEWMKTIFNCMIAELTYKKDKYMLFNGKWFETSTEFYSLIESTLKSIDDINLGLPIFKKGETESQYNDRASQVIDAKELHLTGYSNPLIANGSVEPADIVTKNREFLYVKKGTSSSYLSHLFKQATVAASLLSNNVDEGFRDLIIKKTGYPTSFLDGSVSNNLITIVFVIIRNKHDLPFFSKISLMETINTLKAMNYKMGIAWVDVK